MSFMCCSRQDMIDRLCRVFGVDYAEDPDDSYVLTSDNFLKMMAIHMRFRYVTCCEIVNFTTNNVLILYSISTDVIFL